MAISFNCNRILHCLDGLYLTVIFNEHVIRCGLNASDAAEAFKPLVQQSGLPVRIIDAQQSPPPDMCNSSGIFMVRFLGSMEPNTQLLAWVARAELWQYASLIKTRDTMMLIKTGEKEQIGFYTSESWDNAPKMLYSLAENFLSELTSASAELKQYLADQESASASGVLGWFRK